MKYTSKPIPDKKLYRNKVVGTLVLCALWYVGINLVIYGITTHFTVSPRDFYRTLKTYPKVAELILITLLTFGLMVTWALLHARDLALRKKKNTGTIKLSISTQRRMTHLYIACIILFQLLCLTLLVNYLGYDNPSIHTYTATALVLVLCGFLGAIYYFTHTWVRELGLIIGLFETKRHSALMIGAIGFIATPFALGLFKADWLIGLATFLLILTITIAYVRKRCPEQLAEAKAKLILDKWLISTFIIGLGVIIWLSVLCLGVYNVSSPAWHPGNLSSSLQQIHLGAQQSTPGATLEFTASNMDVNTQTLQGYVQLCLPPQLALPASGNGSLVLVMDSWINERTYQWAITNLAPSTTPTVASCDNSNDDSYTASNVNLKSYDQKVQLYYPSDHYPFRIYSYIYEEPGNVSITPQVYINLSGIDDLEARIGKAGWDQDWTVSTFLLQRNTPTILYTYAVALAPLIILVIVAAWVLSGKELRVDRREQVFGIGLVVIIILPLRSVLVPATVSGITSVDLILGFELVSSALLLGLYYVRELAEEKYKKDEKEKLVSTSQSSKDVAKPAAKNKAGKG